MIKIDLTQNKVALIDDVDADLSFFKWCTKHHTGGKNERFYAVRRSKRINGKSYIIYMHRVILERMLQRSLNQKEVSDHINHIGTDNRRENLRISTQSENLCNQRIQNICKSSQYKGVCYHKNRWMAYIKKDRKRKHIGYFDTEEEAAKAYDKEARKIFTSFCCLNFPED